jgi:hypothetical protein
MRTIFNKWMARMQARNSLRRVRSEFASLKEWGDWVNANCAPRRADDTPVLMGQTGPRKRATREELMALIEEQRARHGWPPYDPSKVGRAPNP